MVRKNVISRSTFQWNKWPLYFWVNAVSGAFVASFENCQLNVWQCIINATISIAIALHHRKQWHQVIFSFQLSDRHYFLFCRLSSTLNQKLSVIDNEKKKFCCCCKTTQIKMKHRVSIDQRIISQLFRLWNIHLIFYKFLFCCNC